MARESETEFRRLRPSIKTTLCRERTLDLIAEPSTLSKTPPQQKRQRGAASTLTRETADQQPPTRTLWSRYTIKPVFKFADEFSGLALKRNDCFLMLFTYKLIRVKLHVLSQKYICIYRVVNSHCIFNCISRTHIFIRRTIFRQKG